MNVGDDAHIVPFFYIVDRGVQCAPCGLISDPQHILRKNDTKHAMYTLQVLKAFKHLFFLNKKRLFISKK